MTVLSPFKNDAQKISTYYDKVSSRDDLDDFQRCGWSNPESQRLRFLMLSLLSDFDGCTVLDVGCGLGDFFGFLVQENIKAEYAGIDVSGAMIEKAGEKYPEGTFSKLDFLDEGYEGRFDYIVASGAWSLRVGDQDDYVQTAIRKMFRLSHQAIAFNMLSTFTPEAEKNEDRFYYYDPVKILEFCLSITPFVELKQNYLANDFTVFMYR